MDGYSAPGMVFIDMLKKNNIAMKIYKVRGEVLLAACDREILGKKFMDGKLQIEIKKDFYFGSFVTEQTFLNSMKIATIANLSGKKVVEIAIREGYIDKDSVIKIKDIPHAQMVLI